MGKRKLQSLEKLYINKSINLALDWLIKSGIQNNNYKNTSEFGAYNAWFNSKKKKYSYMYSEISGYLITSMIYHYKISKKPIFLKSAKHSADWLINNAQHENGGFLCLFLVDNNLKYKHKESLIYSFDNGVIITGLVNLYKETKDKRYLKSAIRSADFMCDFFFKKSNQIKPIYDLNKKKFIENKNEWSMVSGSYHTKIAMGYLNLYKLTKIKKYLICGKKILDTYSKKQKTNGEFYSTKSSTNLHPHCYSAEGYWACGKFLNNSTYKNIALKSIKWVLKNMNSHGFPPRLKFKKKLNFNERIDVLSQTLRLIVLNKKNLGLNNSENLKIKKLTNNILQYQNLKKKLKREKGGFFWGKKSNGKNTSDINTWTTAFAIQSLSILNDQKSFKLLNSNPFYLV